MRKIKTISLVKLRAYSWENKLKKNKAIEIKPAFVECSSLLIEKISSMERKKKKIPVRVIVWSIAEKNLKTNDRIQEVRGKKPAGKSWPDWYLLKISELKKLWFMVRPRPYRMFLAAWANLAESENVK